jgi:hypothetical protein
VIDFFVMPGLIRRPPAFFLRPGRKVDRIKSGVTMVLQRITAPGA